MAGLLAVAGGLVEDVPAKRLYGHNPLVEDKYAEQAGYFENDLRQRSRGQSILVGDVDELRYRLPTLNKRVNR